jgi:uncharacterized SAM-binding protein YcdF (DUF218 family)
VPVALPPPDAIVVLGCRVEPNGELSAALKRRTEWARVAFEAGLGRFIVPAGGRRWGEHVEAERMAAYLEAHGVPGDVLHPELLSLTTSENAAFSREILDRIGARRALVVTCDWHVPRAIACFRAVGVDALPIPVPPPPAPLGARLLRNAHELVSRRLDAWTLERRARTARRVGFHPFGGGER